MKISIEISEPWDFITRKEERNHFVGQLLKENAEHTKLIVQLNEIIEYKGKRFNIVVCEVRYVGQRFDLKNSSADDQICAITGIPDEYFDITNPFSYDMNTSIYLIGAITAKK